MSIPINPYVAGNPVGDSPAFIGRADVLREVLRDLARAIAHVLGLPAPDLDDDPESAFRQTWLSAALNNSRPNWTR
jgi:hypothetical protein